LFSLPTSFVASTHIPPWVKTHYQSEIAGLNVAQKAGKNPVEGPLTNTNSFARGRLLVPHLSSPFMEELIELIIT